MSWSIILKIFLRWLIPFLGKQLWDLLNNAKLRKLALKAVENAVDMDLDNDDKQHHAKAELQQEAMKLGIEIRDAFANALITSAYSGLKEQMEKETEKKDV